MDTEDLIHRLTANMRFAEHNVTRMVDRNRLADAKYYGGVRDGYKRAIEMVQQSTALFNHQIDSLPEGLYAEVTTNGMSVFDAQDVKWVTVHKGGPGDSFEWGATIRRRVLTALGLPYKASQRVYADYHDQANGDH
jgi:hypothetical protein